MEQVPVVEVVVVAVVRHVMLRGVHAFVRVMEL